MMTDSIMTFVFLPDSFCLLQSYTR